MDFLGWSFLFIVSNFFEKIQTSITYKYAASKPLLELQASSFYFLLISVKRLKYHKEVSH